MGNKVSNKYSGDFKKTVVELYQSGQSVRNLSSEYGVSEVTIYKWIKKFSSISLEDGTAVTPDDFVRNSELKYRHGYNVAKSSGLLDMELQGAMAIFTVNLKRILKLMD